VEHAGTQHIFDELRRRRPIDCPQGSVRFETEAQACTCGEWAGMGCLFEWHRAQAIQAKFGFIFVRKATA